MLKATYARDHLWREVVLRVRCGFTACGEHLGHLTAHERDGARVWWVSVNQSFTQRQPGLWALSRHARRSRGRMPHLTQPGARSQLPSGSARTTRLSGTTTPARATGGTATASTSSRFAAGAVFCRPTTWRFWVT